MSNLSWQDIAHRDPYLSGAIAARSYGWWDLYTAESEADSVGLTGEQRTEFLRGWQEQIAEQEKERKEQLARDYDEMSQGAEKGDPAR